MLVAGNLSYESNVGAASTIPLWKSESIIGMFRFKDIFHTYIEGEVRIFQRFLVMQKRCRCAHISNNQEKIIEKTFSTTWNFSVGLF